ncbi:MAG: hypothetical protein HY342_10915 [Candidatus Lambdaproteobacteria bacterium]|nr:hypothetical protein [Candidatus Lambdaproteobacteria bacterium]
MALGAALALLLGLALGGCDINLTPAQNGDDTTDPPTDFLAQSRCDTVGYGSAAPLAFGTTLHLGQVSFNTSASGFTSVMASLPQGVDALSVGVVVRGLDSTLQTLDHGVRVLSQPPLCLTTPLGPAPLAFNRVNVDQDAEEDIDQNLLFDQQTVALFYPNDGSVLSLPAGTYTFPVASSDLGGLLISAPVAVDVYYKVAASLPSEMRVNLWVVQGVGSGNGLQTQDEVNADLILGIAAVVLNNVYGNRAGLNLNVRRILLPDVPELLIIDSQDELDALFAGHPSPPEDDALNMFVVDQLALPGVLTGVVGLASRIPGPFNLDGTAKSGIVVEYQSSGSQLGYTLAHELGHYLGLYHTSQQYNLSIVGHDPIADTPECTDDDLGASHDFGRCPDVSNLMFPFVTSNSNPLVSQEQVNVIRLNPAISTP